MSQGSQLLSLHSLSLDRVFLTQQIVSDLLVACVSLEDLTLNDILGLPHLKICSSKLRRLSLTHLLCKEGSVEVATPNLEWIRIFFFHVGEYTFKEMASLVTVDIVLLYYSYWGKVVRQLGNVKHLIATNYWFELLVKKEILAQDFVLNNLNLLEMRTGYSKTDMLGIAALFELSPNLNTMILDKIINLGKEETLPEELMNKQLHFSLPSLKQVKIRNFKDTDDELQFISLLGKHGVVLEKIVLVPARGIEVSLEGLTELKLSGDLLHIE